jgi:hypothetical protein
MFTSSLSGRYHSACPARRAANHVADPGTLVPEPAEVARLRYRAFTDELRAGEHEQRTTSMTALQDWLSYRPVDPRGLKALICDAFRGNTSDEPETNSEPIVMGRGLERC